MKENKWTILYTELRPVGYDKTRKTYAYCRCECGNNRWVVAQRVGKYSFSCKSCANKTKGVKHNKYKTPLYSVWLGMKSRCKPRKNNKWQSYIDKGIYVCDEWKDDFEAFYIWALDKGYKKGLSIERINNHGPYAPDNCKWATSHEQSRNKSNNIFIEHKGKKMIFYDWIEHQGLTTSVVEKRMFRKGLTRKQALGLED